MLACVFFFPVSLLVGGFIMFYHVLPMYTVCIALGFAHAICGLDQLGFLGDLVGIETVY